MINTVADAIELANQKNLQKVKTKNWTKVVRCTTDGILSIAYDGRNWMHYLPNENEEYKVHYTPKTSTQRLKGITSTALRFTKKVYEAQVFDNPSYSKLDRYYYNSLKQQK